MRKTLLLSAVILCVSLALEMPQLNFAYTYIRVSTSSDPDVVGAAVSWDLSDNSRPNINDGRVQYVIGEAGTEDADDFDGPFTEFQAIQRSFIQWRNIEGSDIDFEFTGLVENPVDDANDDVNTIFWDDSGFDAGVFAVTITSFDTSNGDIVDADLIFNDADWVWDTIAEDDTSGVSGRTYIENIAVHEIGHFIGLDHPFVNNSSLFPYTDSGAISLISLSTDDMAPMMATYPAAGGADPDLATVSGTVTSSGTGRLGIHVTLIDIATGEAVISALTGDDTSATNIGEYEIVNVPPGNYWVIASKSNIDNLGSYYSTGFTSFLPAARGVDAGTVGAPDILQVTPGANLTDIDLEVINITTVFEDDDDFGDATAIAIGDAVGSRLENSADEDYFSFPATLDEVVRIQVHADAMGQDLNPEITLYDTDGTTELQSSDPGSPVFEQHARDIQNNAFSDESLNYDCYIEFTIPATGTYFVAVTATGSTSGDYVLTSYSDLSFDDVDTNATTIEADVVGVGAGGADFTITVAPANTAGAAFPDTDSFDVDLIDRTGAPVVLDTINAAVQNGDLYANVPAADGRLLRMLVEASNAKNVIEIGASTGLSGMWIALGLRKTGGKLTTFELDRGRAASARANYKRAGVGGLVTLVEGDAHENVRKLKEPVDVVFIDADKEGYDAYYEATLQLLRRGGLVAFDNALGDGELIDPRPDDTHAQALDALNRKVLADERVTSSLVPIGDGLLLARKR
ncbi:MAG: class I SAM-dependent methyltransferase [Planctomycetaceae bacterium]|nr:class I SAM-dependent methyltransferase [Planctomycetaceae bacterium]